jgi:hypothetical protein
MYRILHYAMVAINIVHISAAVDHRRCKNIKYVSNIHSIHVLLPIHSMFKRNWSKLLPDLRTFHYYYPNACPRVLNVVSFFSPDLFLHRKLNVELTAQFQTVCLEYFLYIFKQINKCNVKPVSYAEMSLTYLMLKKNYS